VEYEHDRSIFAGAAVAACLASCATPLAEMSVLLGLGLVHMLRPQQSLVAVTLTADPQGDPHFESTDDSRQRCPRSGRLGQR
jgi:hypothetical protein